MTKTEASEKWLTWLIEQNGPENPPSFGTIRAAFEAGWDLAEAKEAKDDETLARVIEEREAALSTVRTVMAERGAQQRSLSFLRGTLSALADEVGLAVEDTAGIVRAVKARDGAGRRAKELEAELRAARQEIASLEDSREAAVKIANEAIAVTQAIAEIVKPESGELLVNAVARVVRRGR